MDGERVVTKHSRKFERSIVFDGRSRFALFGQNRANVATVIVLGLCAFIYIKANVLSPIPGLRGQSDFAVYYRAAKDIVSGTSPYENPAYFYPPLVAFVMTPFALTDYVTARSTWFLLSHLLLLWAGWLLWRSWGRDRIGLCCIACVWAVGGAFKETLDVGQLSPLLVLSLVIAYTPAITAGCRGGRRLRAEVYSGYSCCGLDSASRVACLFSICSDGHTCGAYSLGCAYMDFHWRQDACKRALLDGHSLDVQLVNPIGSLAASQSSLSAVALFRTIGNTVT